MPSDFGDRVNNGGPWVLGVALVVQILVLLIFADTERKQTAKQAEIFAQLRVQLAQGYLIQERLVAKLEGREPRLQPE